MSGRPGAGRLRVLLVGAGGIGNPAALALAAAGAGLVRVLDDDLVEGPNLHRQVLFGEHDVGRPKAVALAETLLRRFPATRVEPLLARALPETALEFVRGVDVVLDGTDNFASRFLLADAAHLAEKPIVHAASVRWEGTCFVSGPRGRPCYRCLFEDLPEGPAPDCASAGVVGAVCGVIGGVAADAALRVGAGEAGLYGTVVSLDGRHGELRRIEVGGRPACPLCGEGASIRSLERGRYLAPACGVLGRFYGGGW
jgi:molybdopterin/thiamine biosynthesis adenylyltransferase